MAMIKNKHITFSLVLMCLIAVSPMAKAQLGLDDVVSNLVRIVNVNGVLFCTLNGALNGTSALPFANAVIQLQCGSQNTVVSNATTDVNGVFSFLNELSVNVLLSNCRLVLLTPRSSCNPNFPPNVGSLVSRLNFVGSFVSGLLNFVTLVPAGFAPIIN